MKNVEGYPKVIKIHGSYFPEKSIWLVDLPDILPQVRLLYDKLGNQYLRWYRSEKKAFEHIRHCKRNKYDCIPIIPTKWKPCKERNSCKFLWLVFDLANGHPETNQYVWGFKTKTGADEFIKSHIKCKTHYDVSIPTKWELCRKQD